MRAAKWFSHGWLLSHSLGRFWTFWDASHWARSRALRWLATGHALLSDFTTLHFCLNSNKAFLKLLQILYLKHWVRIVVSRSFHTWQERWCGITQEHLPWLVLLEFALGFLEPNIFTAWGCLAMIERRPGLPDFWHSFLPYDWCLVTDRLVSKALWNRWHTPWIDLA